MKTIQFKDCKAGYLIYTKDLRGVFVVTSNNQTIRSYPTLKYAAPFKRDLEVIVLATNVAHSRRHKQRSISKAIDIMEKYPELFI